MLILSLTVILFLSTWMSVGYVRAITELRAATTFANMQHAFYLAEGGIDLKLTELANDTSADDTRPVRLVSSVDEVVATASAIDARTWRVDSVSQNSTTPRQLMVMIERDSQLPIEGAITILDEGQRGFDPRFFGSGSPNLLQIDGCESSGGPCMPGLVVTSQKAYDEFARYIHPTEAHYGYFGDRLTGADSELPDGADPAHYSVQRRLQSGQTTEWVTHLAAFAKAKAIENGCYIGPFDSAGNPKPEVVVEDQALGTAAAPKICYAEAGFRRNADGTYTNPSAGHAEEVYVRGTVRGAGLWIVEGELDQRASSSLSYEGVIISLGPSAEVELAGHAQIEGAVVLATTSFYEDGTAHWVKPELEPTGTGTIRYNSAAVAIAQALLEDWDQEGFGASESQDVHLLAWGQRDVSPGLFEAPATATPSGGKGWEVTIVDGKLTAITPTQTAELVVVINDAPYSMP
jgi:hypothetical protein